jgi:protein-tyrosine phosphatase
MTAAASDNWARVQQERLDKYQTARTVDIHCHCLPGLDDGPTTLDEAIALCEALVADGITTAVATPHQLGRYDRLNSAAEIYETLLELTRELEARHIPLEVVPGGDVRVDERLPSLLAAGEVVPIADAGRHLLLELPHELYVDPVPIIELLAERGLQAIMTHPERHPYLSRRLDWADVWLSRGACLQITSGSLLGEFGGRAYEVAWLLVENNLASLIASDAHDARRRPPRMSEAMRILTERVGLEVTRELAIDNPLRVLSGETILLPQAS